MFKSLDWPMLGLALLVVTMFSFVGFSIALRNVWLIILFIFLGFLIMGYGIFIKRKKENQ